MPQIQPLFRLATATCALALAITSTYLRADSFTQTNLVSDIPNLANTTDPNLKNPWGVAFSATSPFWTADQGTGLSTLYNAAGTPQALVVTIPGTTPPSGPTGLVFSNVGGSFLVGATPATFIFDNLNGTISGWNGGTTAQVMATTTGAIYTGLAEASSGGSTFLYAADSTGHINVFNSSWNDVTSSSTFAGKFTDPNLPAGFVPFNIQNIGGNLYVTYALLGPGGTPMPGGFVDEFDAGGNLLKRIATGGSLFAPWGIVVAPANFGAFSNDLLIGNFGNGEILAYDATSDLFLGTINGLNGQPLVNDHLWALETRAGVNGFNPNAVYFSAGINNQEDGLFGEITEVPEPATIIETASGLLALALSRVRRRFATSSRMG